MKLWCLNTTIPRCDVRLGVVFYLSEFWDCSLLFEIMVFIEGIGALEVYLERVRCFVSGSFGMSQLLFGGLLRYFRSFFFLLIPIHRSQIIWQCNFSILGETC